MDMVRKTRSLVELSHNVEEMANKQTPSKGVSYINQFPKWFAFPYGVPREIKEDEFDRRLNSGNCELLSRPYTGLSEIVETIESNLEVLDSDLFNPQFSEAFKKKWVSNF